MSIGANGSLREEFTLANYVRGIKNLSLHLQVTPKCQKTENFKCRQIDVIGSSS
jgi:hypothetical protein